MEAMPLNSSDILNIIFGMAAATAILGGIFKLGNNWIIGKIGLEIIAIE